MSSPRVLVCILLVFSTFSFLLAVFGHGLASDLGMNLVSEFIGIAVTLFIVDRWIKANAQKARLPRRHCAYRDLRSLVTEFSSLLYSAYMAGNADKRPRDMSDLISQDSYLVYMKAIPFEKRAPVLPVSDWLGFFSRQVERIKGNAARVLDRHSADLIPEVYANVHQLQETIWDPKELATVLTVTREHGSTQFTALGSLFVYSPKTFESLKVLANYIESEWRELTKAGVIRGEASPMQDLFHTHG